MQDGKSVGFGILCLFFPIVGLILFLVWKKDFPLKAKSCGIGALIGVGVEIVAGIVYAVVILPMLADALSGLASFLL